MTLPLLLFPRFALNATKISPSLNLESSDTHRLNIVLALSALWANAKPDLGGAVLSSTTFQILPAPLPVLSAVHPAGTWPTSSLVNLKLVDLSLANSTAAPINRIPTAMAILRIGRAP